jgi:hypothetical protein
MRDMMLKGRCGRTGKAMTGEQTGTPNSQSWPCSRSALQPAPGLRSRNWPRLTR